MEKISKIRIKNLKQQYEHMSAADQAWFRKEYADLMSDIENSPVEHDGLTAYAEYDYAIRPTTTFDFCQ